MGHPGLKCKLCSKPGEPVVQTCDVCRGRCCIKHIGWHDDKWVCNRCVRADEKRKAKAVV